MNIQEFVANTEEFWKVGICPNLEKELNTMRGIFIRMGMRSSTTKDDSEVRSDKAFYEFLWWMITVKTNKFLTSDCGSDADTIETEVLSSDSSDDEDSLAGEFIEPDETNGLQTQPNTPETNRMKTPCVLRRTLKRSRIDIDLTEDSPVLSKSKLINKKIFPDSDDDEEAVVVNETIEV